MKIAASNCSGSSVFASYHFANASDEELDTSVEEG
jgi:hypothetical protein